MLKQAKKELAQLRQDRAQGYGVPFGRIEELEHLIETKGASHGFAPGVFR